MQLWHVCIKKLNPGLCSTNGSAHWHECRTSHEINATTADSCVDQVGFHGVLQYPEPTMTGYKCWILACCCCTAATYKATAKSQADLV